MLKKIYRKLIIFSESWIGSILIVLVFINFVYQSFLIPSSSMKPTLQVGDFVIVNKYNYGTVIPHLPWLEIPLLSDYNGNGHIRKSSGPKRGDIVVFRYPNNKKTHYVKRCVAIEGDILFVKNKNLYINFKDKDLIKKYRNYEKFVDKKYGVFIKNPYSKDYTILHNKNITLETYRGLVENKVVMTDQRDASKDKVDEYLNLLNYPNKLNIVDGMDIIEDGDNLMVMIGSEEYFMMGDNRENSYDSRFWGTVNYSNIEGQMSFIWFSYNMQEKKIEWDRIFSIPR